MRCLHWRHPCEVDDRIVGGRAVLREVSRALYAAGGLQRVMENLPAAG